MTKHRLLLAFMFLAAIFQLKAQNPSEGFSIIGKNKGTLQVRHHLDEVGVYRCTTTEGQCLSLKGIYLPNLAGAPDLPSHSTFIAIPKDAEVTLKVTQAKTHLINNVDLIPAAAPQLDNDNAPAVHQKDMAIYGNNAYYPEEPFRLSAPTQVRGVDVVSLEAMPFQYNPVTKELLVYDDVELEIDIQGGGMLSDTRYRTKDWDHILSDIILNFNDLPSVDYGQRLRNHYENKETGCEYMIITPDNPDFIQLADSIRHFRIAQGIPTETFTVTDCGGNSDTQIYDFIRNAYLNWDMPPAAVEILGDHNTDPAQGVVSYSMDNHPGGSGYNPYISDHAYSDMTGNQMSDIIVGRITGRNYDELYHIIKKDLDYERIPPTNPDFYDKPITAMGFQEERWFQLCSEIVNGFWEYGLGKHPVRLNAIYSGTPGSTWSTADNTNDILNYFGPNGCDYIPQTMSHLQDWNATSNMVNQAINDGAFIIQHRDHGAEELWGEPSYSISSIKKLQNKDLTFVMSNNCLTGRFNYSGPDGCFAEAFHRHQHGALGLIAATQVSYSFVNDIYVWGVYDNMWPEFMPTFGTEHATDFILPAFGNAAGKYFLRQSSWDQSWVKEITYYLFHHHGDVYMNLYTTMPQNLDIEMLPVVKAGTDTYTVKADEGSVVCLSVGDRIIGLDFGTGNTQQIQITPQEIDTEVLLTVTKQDHYRYERTITVIPSEGPYLIFNKTTLNDASGDQDGMADYEETCGINLSLHNVGNENIENVLVSLRCDHPAVEIINNTATFAQLNHEQIVCQDNAFEVHFGDTIDDGEPILFLLSMESGNHSYEERFYIPVEAPVLQYTDIHLTDTEGNPIDRLTKGETSQIHFTIVNQGHSKSKATNNHLDIMAPFIGISENDISIAPIDTNDHATASFAVEVHEDGLTGGIINYNVSASNNYHTLPSEGNLILGFTSEDFESETLNPSILWNLGSGSNKWYVAPEGGIDGTGCLRTPQLNDSKKSTLRIGFTNSSEDVFSFYHKVSSEENDKLTLTLDGTEVGVWSNESDWQKEEIALPEGNHLFKFVYSKDASGSAGDDCARLDHIQLPPVAELILFAGDDIISCAEEHYSPNAYVFHQESILWSSDGDGHFDDNTSERPTYFYGSNDLETGAVNLTLTAVSEQNASIQSDTVCIFLYPDLTTIQPETAIGDTAVDLNQVSQSHFQAPTMGDVLYHWTLSPEEAGTLASSDATASIVWNPSFKGDAFVRFSVSNTCGESLPSEALTVRVFNAYAIGENSAKALKLYPNPATDKIHIEAEQLNGGCATLRIIDISGKVVYEETMEISDGAFRKELNSKMLGSGLFNIQISDGTASHNNTLIIQ